MDPITAQQPTPLRRRTANTAEFNLIPSNVYPLTARRTEQGGVDIAGVPLTDMADTYGTPAFIMDEQDFRTRCQQMAQAFGGGERVHYASKAFMSKTVCRWVAEEGLALDIASLGELQVALRADFPPARITVHGNNKSSEFLRAAVTAGVELIVIDSLQEIANLSRIATELDVVQDVLVRVTPGVHVDTHEFIATSHEDQKFGFSLASGSAEDAANQCLAADGLRLRGLHCHVGSQVFDADGFVLAAERLLGLWRDLLNAQQSDDSERPAALDQNQAEHFNVLDLGGGYGIAYMPDQESLDVADVAKNLLEKVELAATEAGVPMPTVNVEPGRAIAGPSMVTLYRVGTIKDVETSDHTTRRYVSVDGGMSDNIRPALYQAEYDVRVVNREPSGDLVHSRIVGSHCESGDILVNDCLVPDDIQPGDLISIAATGAYCYSMSSRYNMFMRPPVIVAKDGETRVMIRRETLDDVLALEND